MSSDCHYEEKGDAYLKSQKEQSRECDIGISVGESRQVGPPFFVGQKRERDGEVSHACICV